MGRKRAREASRARHPSFRPVVVIDQRPMVGRSIAAALGLSGIRAHYARLDRVEALRASCSADVAAVGVVSMTNEAAATSLDIIEALTDAGAPTIVLTDEDVTEVILAKSIAAGAAGFVSTAETVDSLQAAVVKAGEGDEILPLAVRYGLEDVLRTHQRELRASLEPFEKLTRREAEVLEELVAGRRADQIAETAFVAVCTVRSQIKSILHKLEVHSQLEAVALANEAHWPVSATG